MGFLQYKESIGSNVAGVIHHQNELLELQSVSEITKIIDDRVGTHLDEDDAFSTMANLSAVVLVSSEPVGHRVAWHQNLAQCLFHDLRVEEVGSTRRVIEVDAWCVHLPFYQIDVRVP